MEIYRTEKLKDDLYCIRETESVNIYIVLGTEKALVIDVGYGYGDLENEIRKITDMPIVVAVTHGDPDHALGSFRFRQVMIHPADKNDLFDWNTKSKKEACLAHRLKKMPELSEKIEKKRFMEADLSGILFVDIVEGSKIDIGEKAFSVIEIPGHSQGSVAFYESRLKWIFTGDTVSAYNLWNLSSFPNHCGPISQLMRSLKKIDAMHENIEEIYSAHGEKPLTTDILESQMDCLRDLLVNNEHDEYIKTFAGDGYRHNFGERIFLYSKEMLDEAIKNGIE